jgi:hypothetical protein
MDDMKDDQALLALAAKAIGIKLMFEADGDEFDAYIVERGKRMQGTRLWNPLEDDGRALQLAVTLDIELRFHKAAAIPSVSASCKGREELEVPREVWGDDKAKATRRAIVRAAAEIGRAMYTAS